MNHNGILSSYKDVLTINEVCEILHISRSTAYRLVSCGALKPVRIGRLVRIPKINMIDFLTCANYNDTTTADCPFTQKEGA